MLSVRYLPAMSSPATSRSSRPPSRWITAVATAVDWAVRHDTAVALALCLLVCARLAQILGQDFNWDLRNYHFYGAYALLHGRWAIDIAPAQVQTWLNPLPYVPFYLAVQHLPPIVTSILFGLTAAPAPWLCYLITRDALVPLPRLSRAIAGTAAMIIALSGSIFREEIGTSFNDVLTAIPLLTAAWLVVRAFRAGGLRRTDGLLIGLAIGLAVGAKLTNLVYAIAITGAVLLLWRPFGLRPHHALLAALGGAAGFLLLAGWPAWELWTRYGNPLFPFYNAIFQSPWYPAENFADARFLPTGPLDALLYPLYEALGWLRTSEVKFRDPRQLAAFPVVVFFLVLGATRRRHLPPAAWPALFLSLLLALGFALWVGLFAVQRYSAPLELWSACLICVAVAAAFPRLGPMVLLLAAETVAILLWTIPADEGRLRVHRDWFAVQVPEEIAAQPTLHVIASGGDPVSYLIPFFPPEHRFVRVVANFPILETRFRDDILAEIASHPGQLRSLVLPGAAAELDGALALVGLERSGEPCLPIATRLETFESCPVRRLAPQN